MKVIAIPSSCHVTMDIGNYTFRDVPPETYLLRVIPRNPLLLPTAVEITVDQGRAASRDIILQSR